MPWSVFYMRVKDNKDGLVFEGPYINAEWNSRQKADIAAAEVTNQTKSSMTLIHIVETNNNIHEAFEKSKPYFDRLRNDIEESKQVMSKPIKKRKK